MMEINTWNSDKDTLMVRKYVRQRIKPRETKKGYFMRVFCFGYSLFEAGFKILNSYFRLLYGLVGKALPGQIFLIVNIFLF